jgi:hypothetical protein
MTALEMQTAFEIEAGIINSTIKPLSSDIFYWINKAVERFIKNRYEEFEKNQKRIEDLRTLVTELSIGTTVGIFKPNSYIALIPSDYLISVGEEVQINYIDQFDNTITKRRGVKEITIDRYEAEIDNPLSEYNLHYGQAKPLRLFYDSQVELMSDGNYTIPYLYLRYIKIPAIVSLPSNNCDLPVETHSEIIKVAVGMFIENIKDSRYQTIENEITHQE